MVRTVVRVRTQLSTVFHVRTSIAVLANLSNQKLLLFAIHHYCGFHVKVVSMYLILKLERTTIFHDSLCQCAQSFSALYSVRTEKLLSS